MSAPDWARTATRPTPAEVEAVVRPLRPTVAAFARTATAPTDAEAARIRPGARRRAGAPRRHAWVGLATAVAAGAGIVWGGLSFEGAVSIPAVERSTAPDPTLFVVTPAATAEPAVGVRVRGSGRVTVEPTGALALDGDLVVEIDTAAPTPFRVGDTSFTAIHAVVAVVDGALEVREGEVDLQGTHVPVPSVQAPERVSVPPVSVPPEPPVPVALEPLAPPAAPVRPDVADWAAVLAVLETDATRETRLATVRAFLASHSGGRSPGSPFVVEAESLALLLADPADPVGALAEVEAWLARHPDAGRAAELHAFAARTARDGLQDCARAEPHDRAVAATGPAGLAAEARAFLGLCAAADGRDADAAAWFGAVDRDQLPAALRRAVDRAQPR